MGVILIFRHLHNDEIKEINSLKSKGIEILSMPDFAHNLPFKALPVSEFLVKDAVRLLINSIGNLGDRKIEGVNLSSLYTFDGISLWHYQRFRVFYLLRNEWIINHCIKKYSEQYDELVCYVPSDFNLSFQDATIPIKIIKKGISSISLKDSASHLNRINYKAIFNYFVFFILRVLISIFRNNHLKDKQFIVIDRSIKQPCRRVDTLEKKWDNFNLYTLFDSDLKELLIISEVETPKIKSSNPFLLHSYYFNGNGRAEKTLYSEWILFKGLLNPSVWLKRKKILNEMDKVGEKLIQEYYWDEPFTGHVHHHATLSTSHEAISKEEKRILATFLTLKRSASFYIFKNLCYKQFFKNKAFKNISAIDENSPATKCILDAARSYSIKTIGIQHGNIGDAQPAYLYTDIDRQNHVMADMTIVWGKYFQRFLKEKSNFADTSISIAGQMRSDLIPAMLKYSAEYKKKLPGKGIIVTYATQPIPDLNFRYRMAFDVFSCFKDHKDITLIVKLHPGEQHAQKYYRDIAEKAGYTDADIRYDIDLYELLAASDMAITGYSTVGSEAVYFGKPLIIYDPYKEDLLNYVSEGVAFQATDSNSLEHYVTGIKEGTISINTANYQRFISNYALAIDGKCTQRTIDVIRSVN